LFEAPIVSQTTGLTVRQYERESLELPIEFTVSDEHSGQVKFSSSSSAAGKHLLRGTLMDVSPGGMGIQCSQFVPRMSEGTIRVYGHQKAGGGHEAATPVFEHRVKVRRVYLTDRQPKYSLGLAFIDPQAGIEKQVAALLAMGRGRGHA
jgi:c-di-GMP-binding flagellar brake protein YcgR